MAGNAAHPGFELLTPHVVISAVEAGFGVELDGMLTAYPSYVNRVYGMTDVDGQDYVAKFYRPGRWAAEAILEEHRFALDCRDDELPVVAPMADSAGTTLHTVSSVDDVREVDYDFALYPKRGGRNFDADRDGDWLRLGGLIGRLHLTARRRSAEERLQCTPRESTAVFLEQLRGAACIHPDCEAEFFELAGETMDLISPCFDGVALHRIHGDCHRGNILDRPDEGLLLIDFDDMMVGPAVQDLWLLLPGRMSESHGALMRVIEGYEEFCELPLDMTLLIEPLRFMRMVYFLGWSAMQQHDLRFRELHPDWESAAFWAKETEDLRDQLAVIRRELDGPPAL